MSDADDPGGLLEVPEGEIEAAVEAEAEAERLELHGWDGDVVDAAEAMLDRALAYGMYVNKGRALPDVRDGLKPVQRRILHSMDEIGARAGRPYVKSAGVVGHVIANYHPHGDTAIYDAMVRMAQPFSLNVPLVDGQGNWGTVGPKEFSDPPAAYRYCLTADARVRLASGATPRIGDLVPGAAPNTDTPVDLRVLGADGEPVGASLVFHSGDHPTLRLRTREGFEVTGTANHPLLVLERAGDGRPLLAWRTLAELRPGARVAVSRAVVDDRRDPAAEALGALLGAAVAGGHLVAGADGVPDTAWRLPTAGKRAFLRALYEVQGGFGADARAVRVVLRAGSRAEARDVLTLLTEVGVVGRLTPGGGRSPHHVVVDTPRDVQAFAREVGFAEGRGRALARALHRRAEQRARRLAALLPTAPGPVVGRQAAALPLDGTTEPASRAARLDYATVVAIEPAGVRPVYSIRVDTDEHAFVANALVNHNTEARLTAAASEWLSDLRPEVVEFRPNFTEKRDEPWVLPVGFPNLLVNGSKGIGWSMACEVPPHNLAEACEAAILLAEEPDAPLEALLERMPGPDFPTGGIVVNPEALAEAYERGQGTFRLQARFHVEQLPGNQQAIVVTELPYGVSPDQVVAEVVKAARAERIQDVTELPKNLSDRSGLRVQIRLKRGGDATRLVADLMRHTSLRVSVGINMTVLVEGVPRLVSLREALDHFVQFRFEVVTRRLVHERDVLLRELHRLVALLAALDAIDEVVRIVRAAEDDDDAREQLKAQLAVKPHGSSRAVPIDDEQAQWILDMPLKRLSRLNRLRLVEERKQKGARVDEIARILESHDELRTIVVRELSHTASRFGGPRRTTLGGEVRRVEERGGKRAMTVVAQPRTDIWVCSTAAGVCAAWPRATRMDGFPLELGAGDRPLLPLATDTEADLNAFAADGTVYRVRAAELPVSARQSKGVRAVGVGRGGQVAALAPLEPEGGYLLLVTARGEVKRVEASVFATSHASGSPAYDVPDGDRIVAVLPHGEGAHALIHSSRGQSLRIELDKLRPVKSPGAGGVAGMRLDGGDEVVAVTTARDGDLLLVAHASGHAKAVPVDLFPVKGRGTGGVQSASTDTPRREPAGPVAAACTMAPGDDALVLSLSGAFTAVSPGSLEPVARAAVSRPLAALVVGDEIVAALAVPPPPAAEVSVPAAEPPEAPPGD